MIYCWVSSDNCVVLSDAMSTKSKSDYMRELIELKLKSVSEQNKLSATDS